MVERDLFHEIEDCTFRNVGGFCDNFFNPKGWRKVQKSMLQALMTEHEGINSRRTTSLDLASLAGRARLCRRTTQALYHTNSQFSGYKQVLVVGEQKKSYDKSRFKADILQLTPYARTQVHGPFCAGE
jgi:hypothetical protein